MAPTSKFSVTAGITRKAFCIGIYGPEGIGKSSLAALASGADFADIEDSMVDLNVPRINGVRDWPTLREWVQSLRSGIHGIDSITRAEDWAVQHVIATKKSNDGLKASDSLEDFKYKAGLQFCIAEFGKLLTDIDQARARGVSFILVAHLRVKKFKNPDDSDFIRYEPRLIDEEKGSNMLNFVQMVDHLALILADKVVTKGKAAGGNSRTIYLDTAPTRICKARGIDNTPLPYPANDDIIWKLLNVNK